MIECRGRNGWFKYDHNFVYVSNYFKKKEATVNIYSKKKGNCAPILLRGDANELKWLLREMANKIDEYSYVEDNEETGAQYRDYWKHDKRGTLNYGK